MLIGFSARLPIPYLNVFLKGKFAISDALLGTLFAGQSVAMGLATLAGLLLSERLLSSRLGAHLSLLRQGRSAYHLQGERTKAEEVLAERFDQ